MLKMLIEKATKMLDSRTSHVIIIINNVLEREDIHHVTGVRRLLGEYVEIYVSKTLINFQKRDKRYDRDNAEYFHECNEVLPEDDYSYYCTMEEVEKFLQKTCSIEFKKDGYYL